MDKDTNDRKALKEDLEIKKLNLEIDSLQLPWWKKPNYLGIAIPATVTLITILTGILTGYLDVQKLKIGYEDQISEVNRIKNQALASADSLEHVNDGLLLKSESLNDSIAKIFNRINSINKTKDSLDGQVSLLRALATKLNGNITELRDKIISGDEIEFVTIDSVKNISIANCDQEETTTHEIELVWDNNGINYGVSVVSIIGELPEHSSEYFLSINVFPIHISSLEGFQLENYIGGTDDVDQIEVHMQGLSTREESQELYHTLPRNFSDSQRDKQYGTVIYYDQLRPLINSAYSINGKATLVIAIGRAIPFCPRTYVRLLEVKRKT